MTGARPNGRRTCAMQVASSGRAGLRRVQRDLFLCLSGRPRLGLRSAMSCPYGRGETGRPVGSRRVSCGLARVCAGLCVLVREGRAGTVRGLLGGSRRSGAIAHIKFASCRKGVKPPFLKTDSVTPVTRQDSCQVRACHCIGAREHAIGHVAGDFRPPPAGRRTGRHGPVPKPPVTVRRRAAVAGHRQGPLRWPVPGPPGALRAARTVRLAPRTVRSPEGPPRAPWRAAAAGRRPRSAG